MKLTILGSGSPEPHKRRASSGYLIETFGRKLLFDCGGGVFDRLLQVGVDPTELDALFLSHLHSDHMMDYARIIHARWDNKAPDLPVFGPAPIAEISHRLFGPEGVFAFDLAARTEFRGSQKVWVDRGGTLPRPWPAPVITEIIPGQRIQGENWALECCEVPHAQPWLMCLGFALTSNHRTFAYSGDAGLCNSFENLAKDADLLLHWCYRNDGETLLPEVDSLAPTPSEIAQLANRVGAKQLVITHIRAQMDTLEAHSIAKAGMAKHFSGKASIAEDLQTYEI